MAQRWKFDRNNDHQLNSFVEWVKLEWAAGRNIKVAVIDADRTENQNRMIYGLYHDIAKSTGQLPKDVERYCKLHYGVPLRRSADDDFCEWYDRDIKGQFDYNGKLRLMDHIDITSTFSKAMCTTYLDTILAEYGHHAAIRDPR